MTEHRHPPGTGVFIAAALSPFFWIGVALLIAKCQS